MQAPATREEFLALGCKSGLLQPATLIPYRETPSPDETAGARQVAEALVRDGLLTRFQAESLLVGKWRGFNISGKYRLLHKLGAGGMGCVYLCEHKRMRRRVALKILPLAQAKDEAAVERFNLEARAVAALDHPNIVRAHDVDNDGILHFIVLEYVDGNNLHDIVRKHGPLSPLRAANYIRQASLGLEHAHQAGLVHRDIKPGNLLLDRNGIVKLLDMGLARFFHEKMDPLLLRQEVGNTLGTAEYVAPEQVDDSLVDIRADIYALGATFYFLLTGNNPFPEAKTTQEKLTFQLVRRPKPVRDVCPEVPEELGRVVDKMMAKEIGERYQTPAEVAEALAPWTQAAIAPPSEEEMPPRILPERGGAGAPNSARPTSSKIGPATPKEVTGPFTPRDPELERESLSPLPSSSEIPILSSEMKPPTPAPKPAVKAPAVRVTALAAGKAPPTTAPGRRPAPAAAAAAAAAQELKKTGPQAVVRRTTVSAPAEGATTETAKAPAKAAKADLKKTMAMTTAKAEPDADERFAKRVLVAGAAIFSAGVGLLLWWLLFGS